MLILLLIMLMLILLPLSIPWGRPLGWTCGLIGVTLYALQFIVVWWMQVDEPSSRHGDVLARMLLMSLLGGGLHLMLVALGLRFIGRQVRYRVWPAMRRMLPG